MRYLLLYVLLQWGCCSANCQPVYFKHYQVEEGLANNTVFSVFQDTRGFMWFGTKEGLNRFDGVSFKAFNMKLNNKQNVKEFVYCIGEGIEKTLWIGTRKGLYEFDQRTERFSLLESTQENEILDIQIDGKGKIWFTADQRLYSYDELSHETRYYEIKVGRSLRIAAINISDDGRVWIASLDGYIFKYDLGKDSFICINSDSKTSHERPQEVNQIYCTNSGKILIGTVQGLYRYDPANGGYLPLLGIPVMPKPVYVRDILHFSSNEYWIASESGVYIINSENGSMVNMVKHDSDPYAISDNAVYAIYRDGEGGIWCGTYFGGVNYYHNRHSNFTKYFPSTNTNSLSGNAIRELCPDGFGNLWIGTEDAGLNKLNIKTGEVSQLPASNQLSSTNIHALVTEGKQLLVGTFQQGLDVLDIKTGKRLQHFNARQPGSGLQSNFIISACKTRDGKIFLGTSHGVYEYITARKFFKRVQEFPGDLYVFSLLEDADGIIWAGTIGNGLNFYNRKTDESGYYRHNPKDSNSLSSNSVCGIFQDSKRNLWISTEGGGLCKLGKDKKTFTRFDTNSGLPSNMVYKVLEDRNKRLWISTSKGLVLFDPAKSQWKIFTKAHGLLTDQFNYSSGYMDPGGRLYFGSVKGLISFNPDLLGHDTTNSPIYITSFQVNNEDLPINPNSMNYSPTFTDTIRLRYDQSSFSIGFAALSYIAADMTEYAYKLEGLDKEWTFLPDNRKVYFTDLSPGEYRFRVKTANDPGSGVNNETTIMISISPPWWRSIIAYILYTLFFVLSAYLIGRAYLRSQKVKQKRKLSIFEQQKEKEIYKAKIEFFTNVAHEIRTPLTLIKGPLEMVIDKVGDQPIIKNSLINIEKNTDRLVALTDQLLDFRKTENQGFLLSFVKVNVPQLVQENFQQFTFTAEQKSLEYTIQLPEENFYAFIDIEAFNKILSNLVGNAMKYANKKANVKLIPPINEIYRFMVEVSNDGEPIPWALHDKIFEPFFRIDSEQPGSGIGLALARALTELHNGVLELKTTENWSTTFVLTLPVHQNIEFRLNSVQKKSM